MTCIMSFRASKEKNILPIQMIRRLIRVLFMIFKINFVSLSFVF